MLEDERGKIGKRVLALAIPVLLENLFQLVFSFVDMIFVGFLGAVALAAVGLGMQVINVILAIIASLTVGTMVTVAYSVGAKKHNDAARYLENSLVLGFYLSILILLFGLFGTDKLLQILGAKGDLLYNSSLYLKYILIPSFLIVYMSIISSALRGSGDTKTPLYVSIVSNALNIFLDYVFVFGKFGFPKMGVAGAALATTLSRLLGMVILFYIIYKRNYFLSCKFSCKIVPEKDVSTQILKIGIPTSLEQLLFNMGALLYATIVLSLGTKVYAAHRIALNVESLSFQPGFAFGVAATTLVGQYKGAREDDLARLASIESWRKAVIFMGSVGVLLFFFPEYLVQIFTRDMEVIKCASSVLKIIAVIQPLLATANVMSGSLRGAGFSKIPMVISGVGMWSIRIPLAYVLALKMGLGLTGAWIAMATDISLKAVANYYMFIIKKYYKKETFKLRYEEAISN
ncbi:MAG: MATE family efflux transporter [Dictyoglomus turgidum]